MENLRSRKMGLMVVAALTAAVGVAIAAAPPAPAPAAAPAKRPVELGPDLTKEIPLPDIRGPLGTMPGPEAYPVQKNLPDPA